MMQLKKIRVRNFAHSIRELPRLFVEAFVRAGVFESVDQSAFPSVLESIIDDTDHLPVYGKDVYWAKWDDIYLGFYYRTVKKIPRNTVISSDIYYENNNDFNLTRRALDVGILCVAGNNTNVGVFQNYYRNTVNKTYDTPNDTFTMIRHCTFLSNDNTGEANPGWFDCFYYVLQTDDMLVINGQIIKKISLPDVKGFIFHSGLGDYYSTVTDPYRQSEYDNSFYQSDGFMYFTSTDNGDTYDTIAPKLDGCNIYFKKGTSDLFVRSRYIISDRNSNPKEYGRVISAPKADDSFKNAIAVPHIWVREPLSEYGMKRTEAVDELTSIYIFCNPDVLKNEWPLLFSECIVGSKKYIILGIIRVDNWTKVVKVMAYYVGEYGEDV